MLAYTMPQQRKEEKSERLRGERDQIKFINDNNHNQSVSVKSQSKCNCKSLQYKGSLIIST